MCDEGGWGVCVCDEGGCDSYVTIISQTLVNKHAHASVKHTIQLIMTVHGDFGPFHSIQKYNIATHAINVVFLGPVTQILIYRPKKSIQASLFIIKIVLAQQVTCRTPNCNATCMMQCSLVSIIM